MSINSVTISGNLTRDPELKMTASGTSLLKFTVAVNERRKNGEEWEDYANFVDCTMFGKRADAMSRLLSKGSKVVVQGRLHYSKYQVEGQTRNKLEVNVGEIDLMAKAEARTATGAMEDARAKAASAVSSQPGFYDSDIPF